MITHTFCRSLTLVGALFLFSLPTAPFAAHSGASGHTSPEADDYQWLGIRIRVFIPDKKHAGAAALSTLPNPADPSRSMTMLGVGQIPPHLDVHPFRRIMRSCHEGDSRGPTVANEVSSRLETVFVVVWNKTRGTSHVVYAGNGPTRATVSRLLHCQTGQVMREKPAKVLRDEIEINRRKGDIIIVEGRVAGKDTIPFVAPSVDYGFDVKWDSATKRARIGITYDRFPSYEVHALRSSQWEAVFDAVPSSTDARGVFLGTGEWAHVEIGIPTRQINLETNEIFKGVRLTALPADASEYMRTFWNVFKPRVHVFAGRLHRQV